MQRSARVGTPRLIANDGSTMNATRATLVFSVPFAALGLVTGYVSGIGPGLLSWALTLPAGAVTFWLGARRLRHKWYSALLAGLFAAVIFAQALHVFSLSLPPWRLVLVIEVVVAVFGFLLGRFPFSSERADEARS